MVCCLRQDYIGYISASGCGRTMEYFGIYQSMKCWVLTGCHEFGGKSKEVIPEKPEMCFKSLQVTVLQSKRNVWIVIKIL